MTAAPSFNAPGIDLTKQETWFNDSEREARAQGRPGVPQSVGPPGEGLAATTPPANSPSWAPSRVSSHAFTPLGDPGQAIIYQSYAWEKEGVSPDGRRHLVDDMPLDWGIGFDYNQLSFDYNQYIDAIPGSGRFHQHPFFCRYGDEDRFWACGVWVAS